MMRMVLFYIYVCIYHENADACARGDILVPIKMRMMDRTRLVATTTVPVDGTDA